MATHDSRITSVAQDRRGRRSTGQPRRCAMSIARTAGTTPPTRGVVFMHCCPSAIAPHVEWALAGVLGRPARLHWTAQPAAPGHLRAEAAWTGPIGTAARLAASLRAWPMLVYEVTEDGK